MMEAVIPEEPAERGTIIRYSLEYPHGEARHKVYRFAAIKGLERKWFTTGATCPENGYTWEELMSLLHEHMPKHSRYFDVIWPVPRMRRVDLDG